MTHVRCRALTSNSSMIDLHCTIKVVHINWQSSVIKTSAPREHDQNFEMIDLLIYSKSVEEALVSRPW